MITPLNLPKAPLKLSRIGGTVYVFCEIRKKKLVLTPEEWVRQHFVHYLINEQNVSKGRIVSEIPLIYNQMLRRSDILVLDDFLQPQVLIECKAPEIPINKKTFHQWAQYHSTLKVQVGVLTNGLDHHLLKFEDQNMEHSQNLNDLDSWFKELR
jgi:hypothetical protein